MDLILTFIACNVVYFDCILSTSIHCLMLPSTPPQGIPWSVSFSAFMLGRLFLDKETPNETIVSRKPIG